MTLTRMTAPSTHPLPDARPCACCATTPPARAADLIDGTGHCWACTEWATALSHSARRDWGPCAHTGNTYTTPTDVECAGGWHQGAFQPWRLDPSINIASGYLEDLEDHLTGSYTGIENGYFRSFFSENVGPDYRIEVEFGSPDIELLTPRTGRTIWQPAIFEIPALLSVVAARGIRALDPAWLKP